jgi:hypothetical protein
MEVTFKLDKETLNKKRFTNQEGDVVGTLYLSKEQAGDKTEIKVSVDA